MSLTADTGSLAGAQGPLQGASSAAALAGQTAEQAYSSASGACGHAGLSAALDDIGGISALSSDVIGTAVQALGALAGSAAQFYTSADQGLADRCPAPRAQ